MSPTKPLSMLVDEVIENEVNVWIEAKHQDEEAEQGEFEGWDA